MKNRHLLIVTTMGLALSACTFGGSSGEKSSNSPSSYDTSSIDISSSESKIIHSESSRDDDSLPYSTVVSNSLEELTVGEVLSNFKKVDYNYYAPIEKDDDGIWMPATHITNHQELVDIFDYCGFYKINNIKLTISNLNDGPINEQLNNAYWDSSMLPGTVGMTYQILQNNDVSVSFKFCEEANSFIPLEINEGIATSNFPYIYDYTGTKQKISEIPVESRKGSNPIAVHNSDQLIYVLTHGYIPYMKDDSPAKKIYDKAKEILKDIIYVDMKDEEKLTAIEFYLNNNNKYDYVSDGYAAYVSAKHSQNTEEMSALFRGFYAEGAIFNGGAVCYGFAKAQALLASMLGFQVKLTHGTLDMLSKYTSDALIISEESGNVYSAHGISLVRKDDNSKWGICDPTYRYAGQVRLETGLVYFNRRPAIMMNYSDWKEVYQTADEVAFNFMNSSDFVRESYHFADDYKLANGATLNPTNEDDARLTMAGIVQTIKKAIEIYNITTKGFYTFTLYPQIKQESEAENYYNIYNLALQNSELARMDITIFGWRVQTYFLLYGFNVIVNY